MKSVVFALGLGLTSLSVHAGVEPVADEELSGFTAQDGITLDLKFRANASANGVPYSDPGLNNCAGVGNGCRLAIEFANRTGKWIVMKDYYFVLNYNNLRMTADVNRSTATAHVNLSRFQDKNGNVLLASPNSLPVVAFSFDPVSGYKDVEMTLNMGRVSAEFDSGPGALTTPCSPSTPALTCGYNRDQATGSVLGFRITDSQTGVAGIDLNGKVKVYGF